MPLLFNGDSSFMFSLALVKFTSLTWLRRNSVAFIRLENSLLSKSLMLGSDRGAAGPPPSHPLELKTSGRNSLSTSNKLLLSIVFKAFSTAEWIMAVGNCFHKKFTPRWFIDLFLSALSYHCETFSFCPELSPLHGLRTRRILIRTTAANDDADNKSLSVVNNCDRLINFSDDV